MRKIKLKKSGFTLVETVVYLAIVAILLTSVINLNLVLGNNYAKLSAKTEASASRRLSLAALDYLIKNSDGLLQDTLGYCSEFSSSPSLLALYFADDEHLPGACVGTGGGVKINLKDRRLAISCHPDMPGNGYHKNCDDSYYPAQNVYYLSSPSLAVLDNGLDFSLAEGSSISSDYISIDSYLALGSLVAGQSELKDISAATSTVAVLAAQSRGPVTWWRFEEGSGTTALDSAGDNDADCSGITSPDYIAGLIDGSSYALDFPYADGNTSNCAPDSPTNPDDLNFGDAFSLTAWVKPEVLEDPEHSIIFKADTGNQRGYHMFIDGEDGRFYCRIYDDNAYQQVYSNVSVIGAAQTYFLACIYDYEQELLKAYAYRVGTGVVVNFSASTPIIKLVNTITDGPYINFLTAFHGIVDEVRFYNRALSNAELAALQSAGDY
ncbi:MAG: prepilin-type N-terminal cleavage/methylation domain-containing protein [Patescibacteria group bacterium]|nr:prepilin-type N-terminal cleavage/methylation domain-containing protein [Patescibacteria group bacterium]